LRSSRAKRRHSASLCPFNTTRMALVEGGSLLRPDMTPLALLNGALPPQA
jgi:hypothetical protein